MFRKLRANEIEVRTQSVKDNGAVLLLYKDARCDMNILDETVGAFNWKREHVRDNANCIVSIWDKDKEQWVSKEDTGTESNTEKAKGLASDSFKRACFNWGIGRELYTSPFIWVNGSGSDLKYAKYECSEIGYDDNGAINLLEIKRVDKGKNEVVYTFGKRRTQTKSKKKEDKQEGTPLLFSEGTHKAIERLAANNENNREMLLDYLVEKGKKYNEMTQEEASEILKMLDKGV